MMWYVISALLFVTVLFLLLSMFVRDRRYLKKKTSEVMGKSVRDELEEEKQALILRQEKFQRILKLTQARQIDTKSPHGSNSNL